MPLTTAIRHLTSDNTAVLTKFFNDTHGVNLSVDNYRLKDTSAAEFRVTFAQLLY
jgi:hypothetical protein